MSNSEVTQRRSASHKLTDSSPRAKQPLEDTASCTGKGASRLFSSHPVNTSSERAKTSYVSYLGLADRLPISLTSDEQGLLKIYDCVAATRVPNYLGARISIPSGLNIPAWKEELADYYDAQIIDFLQYGWPMSYELPWPPTASVKHHQTALSFPDHIDKYIAKEQQAGALCGPFEVKPFGPWFTTSPMLTRPKKSSINRRVIIDLSWPKGESVNDGVRPQSYLSEDFKLQLPSADLVAQQLRRHGKGAFMFSHDLQRAYGQLRTCPLDWPLLGVEWGKRYFFHTSPPFGARVGTFCAQRTALAVCYMAEKADPSSLMVFVDDFLGIKSTKEAAQESSERLSSKLKKVGLVEATEKRQPPSQVATWIGIQFNSLDMTMKMPADKVKETLLLVQEWARKTSASKRELQHLLGKLNWMSQCVRPGRLFVSRMLHTLRQAYHQKRVQLSDEFRADLAWWLEFLPDFNGVSCLEEPSSHFDVREDACLTGAGGTIGTSGQRSVSQYYGTTFPEHTLKKSWPITQLEALNCLAALRLWSHQLAHSHVRLKCDNAAAVSVLQSGRGLDPTLLAIAREVWLLQARHQFTISVNHCPGRLMVAPDALSRRHLRASPVANITELQGATEISIHQHMFDINA